MMQRWLGHRRGALERWLRVLLLKPQTRDHPLLLQFLGLLRARLNSSTVLVPLD